MKSQLELLEIQDQEAVKNTYYRYPKITPHINKYTNYIEIKTIDDVAIIQKIDEVILYIIARFKWVPAWLAQQWFELYGQNGYNQIERWIRVGIVWAQTGSTGVFIRPTYFLFELMDINDTNYADIPFNLLNHTCAEMQIVFDVMMGNNYSELWYFIQNSKCLPTYHPLNIKVDKDAGVPILVEDEYKCKFDPNKLKEGQDKLIASIRNKDRFTAEFQDYSLWTLVTEDETNYKYGLYTQRPDLVIPAFRLPNGQAQSWAIEMELSAKTGNKYDKIMNSYKNNLIYGYLIYLCGNNYIVEQVKKAYKEAGGLGTCRLFVAPWTAPAQRITNYSAKEEQAYKMLLDSTIQSTKSEDEKNGTN
jgi:hypothetical protein